MFQLFFMDSIEEFIYDAFDLGVYNSINYKINGDITYVSFRFEDLSVSGAYRNNKCVVLKIWLYKDDIKIPVIGGTDAAPTKRSWITNERNLKKKTLETINKIKSIIEMKKQRQSFEIQRAI